MNDKKNESNRWAICVNNADYELSLENRKVYQVIADEKAEKHVYVHVIDETGEDYAFPEENFVFVTLPAKSNKTILALS